VHHLPVCERQCANLVHHYDEDKKRLTADESLCVNCHRCVSLCPTRALKIVKTDHIFKENANWKTEVIEDIYRQAGTGGVLLASMGTPKDYPVYWDKMLINASQVTNPSIDPLREPMETRTYLGRKSSKISRDAEGRIIPNSSGQLKLDIPIMFSAMSYGSISYNAHKSLPWRPASWAPSTTPAKGACTRTSITMERIPSSRLPRAASVYTPST
jgi:glutamate synthase domain-containing protein 2